MGGAGRRKDEGEGSSADLGRVQNEGGGGVSGSGEAFVCVGLVASLVLVGLFMARGRIYLWESVNAMRAGGGVCEILVLGAVSFVSVRHSPWPPLPTLSASTCH